MKKVLIDTNIILDIALERKPFLEYAINLFQLIDDKKIIAFLTATTITDIYYISKKIKGHEESIAFIKNLTEVVNIIGVDKVVILNALSKEIKDFEDAIQISASEFNHIDYIVTRNKSDFKSSNITVYSAEDMIDVIKK